MERSKFPLTLPGGVCTTIIAGLCKQGVANVFNLNPQNQHYTAFLVIDEKTNRIQ
jgi:hypothetical protein